MHKAIVPTYLKDFRCDGKLCPDNCCEGTWTIFVDEPHFKRMKRITDPEIKPIIQKYVKRNRKNPTTESFGRLLQEKKINSCAFLTEDKLCNLQVKMGPEYLCNICMIYPRRTNYINGQSQPVERSLSLSCPLAAELVLLNPQGVEFEETLLDLQDRDFFTKKIDLDAVNAKRKDLPYFTDLRIFTMQLLKTRDLALWKRLVILGMFFEKIKDAIEEGNKEAVIEEIERYKRMVMQGMFNDLLEQIPAEVAIQMKLCKEVVDHRIYAGASEGFTNVFWDFLRGIQFDLSQSDEENAKQYQEAYQTWYQPFMASREHILENYIVNYAFSRTFPMTDEESPLYSYAMMIVHFSVVKMLLIGNSAYYKEEFQEKHVINVIQKFVKSVEHNPQFINFMYNSMKNNGYLTVAHMAILIRN